MKKRIFLTMSIMCCTLAFALAQTTPSTTNPYRQKREITPYSRHNVRLSIGAGSYMSLNDEIMNYHYTPSIGNDYYNSKISNFSTQTPAISAEYAYAVTKAFHIGARLSYYQLATYADYLPASTVTQTSIEHRFMVAPLIRVHYFQRGLTKLYGDVSGGIALINQSSNKASANPTYQMNYRFTGQINFIGVSFGQKFYGFANIGYGNQGIVSGGIGYNFD